MTRDGRRLLLFFNIEPIPRVKWPAAAGWAERERRRRGGRWCAVGRASRRVRGESEQSKAEVRSRVVDAGSSYVSSQGSKRMYETKWWVDSERWRCWIIEGQVCALLQDDDGVSIRLLVTGWLLVRRSVAAGASSAGYRTGQTTHPQHSMLVGKNTRPCRQMEVVMTGEVRSCPASLDTDASAKTKTSRICCQLTLFQTSNKATV